MIDARKPSLYKMHEINFSYATIQELTFQLFVLHFDLTCPNYSPVRICINSEGKIHDMTSVNIIIIYELCHYLGTLTQIYPYEMFSRQKP